MKTARLATFTIAALLAGCNEDGPASMIEAEPETFDTETVYEIVSIGGRPSLPGEQGAYVQFDSDKAKRLFAEKLDARFQLEPLSAASATQVWDNKHLVYVMGVTAEGNWWPIHAFNAPPKRTLHEIYGPDRRREEVPR